MTREEIKANTIAMFLEIVPEVEAEKLDAEVSFRDQVEIDSIDYLNFVLALEKRLGIKIPEVDYPKLASLDGCLSCLEPKVKG
jgi:acyl carrier protein